MVEGRERGFPLVSEAMYASGDRKHSSSRLCVYSKCPCYWYNPICVRDTQEGEGSASRAQRSEPHTHYMVRVIHPVEQHKCTGLRTTHSLTEHRDERIEVHYHIRYGKGANSWYTVSRSARRLDPNKAFFCFAQLRKALLGSKCLLIWKQCTTCVIRLRIRPLARTQTCSAAHNIHSIW